MPPNSLAHLAARHEGTVADLDAAAAVDAAADDGGRRLRSAVQRGEPSRRLAETLDLVEETAAVSRSQKQIYATIEGLTGLRFGELQALSAVADGAAHYRAVARATGQADPAAEATCAVLERKGLLARHAHPEAARNTGEATLVHVTAAGTVALQQAEALRVRLIDSVLATLDAEDTDRLRTIVSRVNDAAAPRRLPAIAGLITRSA
ncbi:hypothetical protein FE374_10560 [Georgenia yuyongxinii]|uniref:MarR family transcriptional regulator n=1 Tax=Georgenia yuyongxinii TaxID=2589797 RepID=A0A5B8C2U1_9MICO|nr:hypothetical protein [Georgenia yuyongxinii]QDC24989.1 hypothetical protein FE374_10560 [Georgenia yuyongxinii]